MRKAESEESTGPPPFQAGDYRTATAAGLLALLLYACTLAPTVTGEDSGELIGAAWTLGVPHPPGYPVWTMLAHAFTWLPVGTAAWRVNLVSAACGAATVFFLVLLGISLTQKRWAAFTAAALFAVSHTFWEQALIAEVYTLNTLFMALMLLIGVRARHGARPGTVYTLALLGGASTGVHNTQILLLPFWGVLVWRALPPALRRSPSLYLKGILLFVVGASVQLYLPIAAQFDPAVNWGNPDTLPRWLAVLRRDQFAFMLDQYPRSLPRFLNQLATMLHLWFRDFRGLGALLGLFGIGLLFRRDRFLAFFLLLIALATVLAITWMQNFEQSREWLWVMRVFLLPAELITAVGIACALAWARERVGTDADPKSRNRVRPFLAGLAIPVFIYSLTQHTDVIKRQYFYAEDFARNILATLPENSVYVPGADHQAFPVMYLQAVEGMRPDVTILRKYGYLDLFSVPGLDEANPDVWGEFPKRRYEPEILGWLLEHTDRPLVLSRQVPVSGYAATFEPLGLLVQALRPNETAIPGRTLDQLEWRHPLPDEPVSEYSLSLFQYDVAFAEALSAFAEGRADAALSHVEKAAEFGHREPEILNNLGVLCGRYAQYDAAEGYFREILAQQPDHTAAGANLARVLRKRVK